MSIHYFEFSFHMKHHLNQFELVVVHVILPHISVNMLLFPTIISIYTTLFFITRIGKSFVMFPPHTYCSITNLLTT